MPTPVAIDAVPIVVESTTEEYFVLYASLDLDAGTTVEVPVLVAPGSAGTTTLAENVEALPVERYRVEKYAVADPADVDGDCIDDITELADPVGMNPVNPAPAVDFSDGAVAVPDRDTLVALSQEGATLDSPLRLKLVLFGLDTDRPSLYVINRVTHPYHLAFLEAVGPDLGAAISGYVGFAPELAAPDGSPGAFYFAVNHFQLPVNQRVSLVERAYALIAASMPFLDDDLFFNINSGAMLSYQPDLPSLEESRIDLVFDSDIRPETDYLALNPGEGYGRLRALDPDDRPHPRDIVIYEALPNELPRVGGIVTTVPQTPLSHVNLRAVQDRVPNAYIRDILDDDGVAALIGGWVHYSVTAAGWSLSAATPAEVDAHYASSRPARTQTPQRDLSVTSITPLSDVGFEDWDAFGVKAANVAVLQTLGFPEGTVPDGFAVPFYFYDEFMKANGLHDRIEAMLADPGFQTDFDTQADALADLRDAIKDAPTPACITAALTAMHASYPEGQSLRYRSSTNNEDLPGFNGAGLYDSKTQHPDETVEDGISKSLKQVYASLWNFRAFTERDFYRIDHRSAAMGVLVHPNYTDERANGVAASFDPFFGFASAYYINTQVGEDLVTNPEAHSVPEEMLLTAPGRRASSSECRTWSRRAGSS